MPVEATKSFPLPYSLYNFEPEATSPSVEKPTPFQSQPRAGLRDNKTSCKPITRFKYDGIHPDVLPILKRKSVSSEDWTKTGLLGLELEATSKDIGLTRNKFGDEAKDHYKPRGFVFANLGGAGHVEIDSSLFSCGPYEGGVAIGPELIAKPFQNAKTAHDFLFVSQEFYRMLIDRTQKNQGKPFKTNSFWPQRNVENNLEFGNMLKKSNVLLNGGVVGQQITSGIVPLTNIFNVMGEIRFGKECMEQVKKLQRVFERKNNKSLGQNVKAFVAYLNYHVLSPTRVHYEDEVATPHSYFCMVTRTSFSSKWRKMSFSDREDVKWFLLPDEKDSDPRCHFYADTKLQ